MCSRYDCASVAPGLKRPEKKLNNADIFGANKLVGRNAIELAGNSWPFLLNPITHFRPSFPLPNPSRCSFRSMRSTTRATPSAFRLCIATMFIWDMRSTTAEYCSSPRVTHSNGTLASSMPSSICVRCFGSNCECNLSIVNLFSPAK